MFLENTWFSACWKYSLFWESGQYSLRCWYGDSVVIGRFISVAFAQIFSQMQFLVRAVKLVFFLNLEKCRYIKNLSGKLLCTWIVLIQFWWREHIKVCIFVITENAVCLYVFLWICISYWLHVFCTNFVA